MSTGAMQQPTGPHTDVSTIPGIVSDLRANFRTGHTRPLEWRRRELGKLRDLFTEYPNAARSVCSLVIRDYVRFDRLRLLAPRMRRARVRRTVPCRAAPCCAVLCRARAVFRSQTPCSFSGSVAV